MPLDYRKRSIASLDVIEVPGDEDAGTVILFHGFGADAFDLVPLSQVVRGVSNLRFFFPNAPFEVALAPDYTGRAWFPVDVEKLAEAVREQDFTAVSDAFPNDISEIRNLCIQLIRDLEIPLSKLFLGGFSQGAVLAADIALHLQDKIGGLLLFSAGALFEDEWKKQAVRLAGSHFFQSHGDHDPLIPLQSAKALEQLLLQAKWKGKLHVFKGGHEIPFTVSLALKEFFTKMIKPH